MAKVNQLHSKRIERNVLRAELDEDELLWNEKYQRIETEIEELRRKRDADRRATADSE